MAEKSLKEKTFSGLGWSTLDKLFQQLLIFVSGILLARKLGNEVYGLIGILSIFTSLANILQESGFSVALVRKKEPSQTDYITVFYTNIFIGLVLYLGLFSLAPFISKYYNQPVLIPLARFLFLSFVFNSFAVIQNVKLLREINYKLIAKINFAATLTSYSSALALAYIGYGVWALASQIVILAFLRSSLLWLFGKWRPSGTFSLTTLKELFSFSSKLMIGSIFNSFATNIPQNVIGKQYSIGVTGLYNQAYKLFNTVLDFLYGSIQSVPFTVLSHIDDEIRLKKAIRKFIRVKALIVFPMFMGIILISNSFITTLLGNNWLGVIPILQLLCAGGIFLALDMSNIDILRIKGKSGKILSLDIFRTILILIVVGLTLILKFNYLFMIGGISICFFIKYIASSFIANKMINYRLDELLKDLLPYFSISTISIIAGYSLHWFINNSLLLMICQISLVSILYIGILYISGSILLKEIFTLTRSHLPKRNDTKKK